MSKASPPQPTKNAKRFAVTAIVAAIAGSALANPANAGVRRDTIPSIMAPIQLTKTDVLMFSKPKADAKTWTASTPLVAVANVILAAPILSKVAPTGIVTFNLDGVITTNPVHGLHLAALQVPNGLPLGTHDIVASYSGDATHSPSSSHKKFRVSRQLDTVILATPDPVDAGADVTYTVTVTNDGRSSAAAVQVVDTLPTGATVRSAAALGGCVITAVITCSLGTLIVGQSASASIVIAAPSLPPGGIITSTATAIAGMNNTAAATVTVIG